MNTNALKCTVIIASMVSGCTSSGGLSRGEQAGIGAASGAALGGLVGGLAGGGKWAAIGAASGAALGGLVTYAFASDPFTQAAVKQSQIWEKDGGAKPQVTKVTKAVENGKDVDKVDVVTQDIPEKEMVSKSSLNKHKKETIKQTVNAAKQTGGAVMVLCPENAPQKVLDEISETGCQVKRDSSVKTGYTLVMARSNKDLNA